VTFIAGNRAISTIPWRDLWLCVPALRQVCHWTDSRIVGAGVQKL
jgi:hypothetical protein